MATNDSGEQVLPTDGFSDFDNDIDAATINEEEQITTDEPSIALDSPEIELDDKDLEDIFSEEEGDDPDLVKVKTLEDKDDKDDKDKEVNAEDKPEDTKLSKREKFENYSRSVQRRINKEVKQREQLREQNYELQERLNNVERYMADSYAQQQKSKTESEYNILSDRIRNATSIKEQLLEDGEYKEVAKVDNDIVQMKIYQARLEEREQNNKYAEEQERLQNGQNQTQQPQQPQPEQQAAYIPNIQKQWIQSNARYRNDQHYTQYVDNVYDTLLDEGYDPESVSLYNELNKRTGTQPIRPSVPQQNPISQARRQAAPAPNVAQAQAHTKNSAGLTESDKVNMRNWGMDPNDPATRSEWLRNKRK